MLQKGIITKLIDEYSAQVRIPVYDRIAGAPLATKDEDLMVATINNTPGLSYTYNLGDVVWISFENDELGKPVIMGLLGREENKNNSTDLKVKSLKVTKQAELAKDTTIGDASKSDIDNIKNTKANIQMQLDDLQTSIIAAGKVNDVQVNGTSYLNPTTKIANITSVPGSIVSGAVAEATHAVTADTATSGTDNTKVLKSGDTMTGSLTLTNASTLKTNGLIVGYAYNVLGNNSAAFLFDKSGSYWTGIGSNNVSNQIHFGPANADGTWVSNYNQTWQFQGTVTASAFSGPLTGNVTGNCSGSSGSCTGNAATATRASTLIGSYTGSGGEQNPNYFGVNKVGCLMMNTTVNGDSHYKDWLIMDAYSGNDVGGATAIGVDRQEMKAFIMGSDAARTSWSRSAELITSSNIGSQTVSNSDKADGLHVHTGRNYEANKIVRTDGNGYIQCGYINSSSGDEKNNSNPSYVWGTNGSDSYLRTYRTSYLSVNYANYAGYTPNATALYSNSSGAYEINQSIGAVGNYNALLIMGKPTGGAWATAFVTTVWITMTSAQGAYRVQIADETGWKSVMLYKSGGNYYLYTTNGYGYNQNSRIFYVYGIV